MIYGYIRVSTDRQTVENQRYEIKRFCQENNLQVDKWISETISGAKEVDKRRLGKLLKGVRKDDIIICSEISRLGRSLFMIMSVLNHCMEIGAKVGRLVHLGISGLFVLIFLSFAMAGRQPHRNPDCIFCILYLVNCISAFCTGDDV